MPELDSWSRAAAAAADALPLAAAGAAGGGDAVIAAAQREATPLTAEPRLKQSFAYSQLLSGLGVHSCTDYGNGTSLCTGRPQLPSKRHDTEACCMSNCVAHNGFRV